MDRNPSASPFSPANRSHLPLPSPSLSPSIASLLGNSNPSPSFNNPQDYFGSSAPNDFFSNEHAIPSPSGSSRPDVRRSSSGGPAGMRNLLSVNTDDEVLGRPLSAERSNGQLSSDGLPRKRPRTADSDQSGRSSQTPHPPQFNFEADSEVDGEMAPPQRRLSNSIPPRPSPTPSTSTQPAPPPQPAAPSRPDPHAIEPSIFNVEPLDEFTREVADWLWGFCQSLDPGEVEVSNSGHARFGGDELLTEHAVAD